MQGENKQKLRQIGQELSNVNASANRLKSLEEELQRAVGIEISEFCFVCCINSWPAQDTAVQLRFPFYFQERELAGAQENDNVNKLGKDIDELQTKKRQLDNELRQLREEQQAMHMQSTTQAKLDMLTKEKSSKEDAIQKM